MPVLRTHLPGLSPLASRLSPLASRLLPLPSPVLPLTSSCLLPFLPGISSAISRWGCVERPANCGNQFFLKILGIIF